MSFLCVNFLWNDFLCDDTFMLPMGWGMIEKSNKITKTKSKINCLA